MVSAFVLTIACWLVGLDDLDPAVWVKKLGSDRFAERVEASKALEALGQRALPALQAAKDSNDPRIRARVAELLAKLDRETGVDRLTRATMIRLDFRDRPLAEVLDTLNSRHDLGLGLHFGPMLDPRSIVFPDRGRKKMEDAVRSRKITVEAPTPLPFWDAIDRLCEAGSLQHEIRPEGQFNLSKPQFLLFSHLGGTSIKSDFGPFRVKVTDLHSIFERDYIETIDPHPIARPRPPGPTWTDRDLAVGLAVIPEPGLVIRLNGAVKLTQAVDEQGRSLLPPAVPEGKTDHASNMNYQRPDLNQNAGLGLNLSLRLPDPSSRSIARLKGSIPVVIVGSSIEAIEIPLEGAAGKSVRNEEVTVTILDVDRDEKAGVTVEVEVVPNREPGIEPEPWNSRAPLDFVTYRNGQLLHRLELLDANRQRIVLEWRQGRGNSHASIQRRVRLTPTMLYEPQEFDAQGRLQDRKVSRPVPVTLRYHGFVQSFTEIPFDLKDIPLP